MTSSSDIEMSLDRLWTVAEHARARGPLARDEIAFVRDTIRSALEARAIRYFECGPLSDQVRQLVRKRQWRFVRPVNAAMARWSLGAVK